MKGAASCIRHEEDKKNREFEHDYFLSILGLNFQSGLKIPFLVIRFFLAQLAAPFIQKSLALRRVDSIYSQILFW
jgi:hypothetical protein